GGSGDANRAAAEDDRPHKKLIQLGWDIPTTEYMRRHWETMDRDEPFNGLIYDLATKDAEGRVCASQSLFQKFPWNRADFESCLEDLKACKFKNLRYNFIRINFYPVDFEWTDDEAWAAVAEKARICAEIARETNGGICFDFESYGKELFRYSRDRDGSFAAAKKLARRRGEQFGRAIFEEYPNVVVLALWLNSINFNAGRMQDPDSLLRLDGYGLLPSFIDGLLDASTPGATLVDGCELGYYMNSRAEFERAALDALLTTGPGAALVAPENRAKYRARAQIGFGFYLDMYANPEGSPYYRAPNPGETRFDRLLANLNDALAAADEYVWVYGEQKRWRPREDESAVEGTSWEDAIPGLTAALRRLRDGETQTLDEEEAALEADGAPNLIQNGDFAATSGPNQFVNWSHWIHEGTPGQVVAIDGKAALKGAVDACFIQPVPVNSRSIYFFSAKTKSTGEGLAVLRARWNDGNGWIAEAQDTIVFPLEDAKPDAGGWIKISGRTSVPANAKKLVLLLGAKNCAADDVVIFDDVKVYERPRD
ncbi:MAG: hypothetical protein HUK22_03855, partial [Thermoguttaceae bacterium]|nr:hypothetical protein [Thermoguttaceae bacterium]